MIRTRFVVRTLLGSAIVAVVAFHLRLLWERLSDQSVLEPAVGAKWLASGLLIAALWRLRSRHHRLFAGKRAAAIWLLALVLHVQVPLGPVTSGDLVPAAHLDAAGWLVILPASLSLSAGLALLLGLLLAGRLAVPNRPPASSGPTTRRLGRPIAGSLPALSSRPPPLLS